MAFPVRAYNEPRVPCSDRLFRLLRVLLRHIAIFDFYSLVCSMGDATGYGMHADYINGWNHTVLRNTDVRRPGGREHA